MKVLKRDGNYASVDFSQIQSRLEELTDGLNREYIDTGLVTQKVIEGLADGISTRELDELAAQTCAGMVTTHPDYGMLAGRIEMSNLHKSTSSSFSSSMERLYRHIDFKTGQNASILSTDFIGVVRTHKKFFDDIIRHEQDFTYDFFAIKTLQRSYLLKSGDDIVERPQYMLLRVAIGIHMYDLDKVVDTYKLMSDKSYTHATPTLFNSGTKKPQLSSCFLLKMKDDSIDGIYDTLKQTAKISQSAGGIGLSIHDVRATGAYIKGTGGVSNGIVPMLRNFDMTARYVDQGGGKRKGSFAIYLEPWHADIMDFLSLKKNHGKEEMRARDLFYALWICDLFMKRVEEDGPWTLFCPSEAPGLSDCHGKEFELLYEKYEKMGKGRKTIKAQELWFEIMSSQIETGTPYMLYKDAANSKSNQKNLGTIKSSNLCTEIMEYTSKDEVAVCNLASISLPYFVKEDKSFDFVKLENVTYKVSQNLDKVIDANYYPVEEARNSNLRHRPIGLGVQGLADVFAMLMLPFDSQEARALNKDIFETMYYASVKASCDLAKKDGPYSTFEGSPASKGILQFDMWGVEPSNRFDWSKLKKEVQEFGMRNSLLMAPMPTASTSQILGNNECFEPFTSNIYSRRTLSGEFVMVNKHLLRELISLGIWNDRIKNEIILHQGSVQNIAGIPDRVKEVFQTVWEISQKSIIDMAADRGAFICQSQSMNLFLKDPNFKKLTSMHFYAWKKGLKTGMYYLRSNAATSAIQFTVDKSQFKNEESKDVEKVLQGANACSLDDPSCESCSG